MIFLAFFLFLIAIALYHKANNKVCVSKKRLDGKTAIVTGGTAGMGLEIAKDFALRGARVIIACPFEDEGINAKNLIIEETDNANVVFKLLDLASLESTRQFAADILNNEGRLDILVNNAGVIANPSLTKDGLDIVMQINYFGAFLLTILLLPLLKKTGQPGEPSRIVNVASALYLIGKVDLDNLNKLSSSMIVYASSKICLVIFSQELSKRIKNCNVVVNCADPGVVPTGILVRYRNTNSVISKAHTWLGRLVLKTPWEGAQTAIHVSVDKKAGETSGGYFRNCKVSWTANKIKDSDLSNKLWKITVQLVKLTDSETKNIFETQ